MGDDKSKLEPGVQTQQLEREIETLRDDMGGIVHEIDRRRHELTDWRLQLHRHRNKLIAVGSGLALWAGMRIWRHRRRARPEERARRLEAALERILENPDALAPKKPGMAGHVAKGIALGAAGAVARPIRRNVAASLRGGR
jgi:hypothetical protein